MTDLLRTQEEILQAIKDFEKVDMFGVLREDLIMFLDFEHAKPFLVDGVDETNWNETYLPPTKENVHKKIANYLPFAFHKAEDERGLSASRSIDHMRAYAWLLGDDILKDLDETSYISYGLPKLRYMESLLD